MSLKRLMLRTAVVAALKNKTIAQDRVFDSKLSALQVTDSNDMLPAVCVYTEADTGVNVQAGDAGVLLERNVDVHLELTVSMWQDLEIPGPQGNPEQVRALAIATTDPELEALLDLFELQTKLTLLGITDEAIALQKIIRKWNGWNSLPGREDNGNNKLCARQVIMPVQINDDCRFPFDGSVITPGPRGHTIFPPLADMAPYLRQFLEGLAGMPNFSTMRDMLQMMYGTRPLPPVGQLTTFGFRAGFAGANSDSADVVDAPLKTD